MDSLKSYKNTRRKQKRCLVATRLEVSTPPGQTTMRVAAVLALALGFAVGAVAKSNFSQIQHQNSAGFLDHQDFLETDAEGFNYLLSRADSYDGPPGEAMLRAGASAKSPNRLLILLCATFKYREVLMNFIWVLETRFGIHNYGVACMDKEMANWFRNMRKSCFRMVDTSQPRALPRPRMELIYHLLEEGVNVLHNDVDAVWGDNNLAILQSADIVGQRDKHPVHLLHKWGSTFCTGVLYIRSCAETKQIIRSMFDNDGHIHFFLDQLRFNRALDATGGISWESKKKPPLQYKSASSKVSDFGRIERLNNLKVAILSQDPYRRECTGNQWHMRSAKIVHCNAPKKSESKEAMLKRYERWELPEEWANCVSRATVPFFNADCRLIQQQESYDDRRKIWCLELAEKFQLRPLSRGSAYTGPLYNANDPKQAKWGPFAKLAAKDMTSVFYNLGGQGCEDYIGRMPSAEWNRTEARL